MSVTGIVFFALAAWVSLGLILTRAINPHLKANRLSFPLAPGEREEG